jgi:hypothetical protein
MIKRMDMYRGRRTTDGVIHLFYRFSFMYIVVLNTSKHMKNLDMILWNNFGCFMELTSILCILYEQFWGRRRKHDLFEYHSELSITKLVFLQVIST